ncbi:MarR family transcriptional regulator, partial [Streptococcus pseudopneumoniae]|nr:MarR family transcriptional regulator [Streptococcus pseudopneumoniae]
MTDKEEVEKGTDPTKADTDGDGLTDKEEVEKGTDPTKADTDGDG